MIDNLVSVIIPTFNRRDTIGRSIRSVLNQTYKKIELIIVDDASTDDTELVVNAIKDDRVHYYKLNRRQGACVARNVGIENATGEFIAFQDSDDEWLNNKLEVQLDTLVKTGADIVSCHMEKHDVDDKRKAYIYPTIIKEGFVSHAEVCVNNYISTQTLFTRANIVQEILFDPNVLIGQDIDWIISATRKYTLYIMKEVLVKQYLQLDSISGFGSQERLVKTFSYWLIKYEDEFTYNNAFYLKILNGLVNNMSQIGDVNTSMYYKEIFNHDMNLKNLIRYICSVLHLMPIVKSIRNRKHEVETVFYIN